MMTLLFKLGKQVLTWWTFLKNSYKDGYLKRKWNKITLLSSMVKLQIYFKVGLPHNWLRFKMNIKYICIPSKQLSCICAELYSIQIFFAQIWLWWLKLPTILQLCVRSSSWSIPQSLVVPIIYLEEWNIEFGENIES